MFKATTNFAMQGLWQAAAIAVGFGMLALVIPPASYLSGAIIVLATLRNGPIEGAKLIGTGLLVIAIVMGAVLQQPAMVAALLLGSWLPAYGLSLVLGYSASLGKALAVATGLGVVLVALFHLLLSDPVAWWRETLTPIWALLEQQANWQADSGELIDAVALMMTGLISAVFALSVMLTLLIGRAWQSMLFNPGGFGDEFRSFSLGKPLASALLVLMLLSVVVSQPTSSLWMDFLPVLLVVFALQGLSVVHALFKRQEKSGVWLVVIYGLVLVMLPQMLLLLAVLGALEPWVNFRRLPIRDAGTT